VGCSNVDRRRIFWNDRRDNDRFNGIDACRSSKQSGGRSGEAHSSGLSASWLRSGLNLAG